MVADASIMMVAEGLVAGAPPAVRLLAGRRRSDGKLLFPLPQGPEGEACEPVELPTEGRLWSWTVQRFRPKTPYQDFGAEPFQPYAVGYVDLGPIIIEARLVDADPAALVIGQPMELTLTPVYPDANGRPLHAHAFRPVQENRA